MRDALRFLPEFDLWIGDRPLFIASDFDGTLSPLTDVPSTAQIPLATVELLRELTSFRRTTLAIVSGRSAGDLTTRTRFSAILVGNNGLEAVGRDFRFEHPDATRLRRELAKAQALATEAVSPWPDARVEDKGLTVTVHYRAVPAAHQRNLTVAVRRRLAGSLTGLSLRASQKAIDIHPRCAWSKGDALTWVRRQVGAEEMPCICMGDDRVDESLFLANPDGINIRVGRADRTAANYSVADPLALIGVFAHLARTLRRVEPRENAMGAGASLPGRYGFSSPPSL
jgi:trehalose 6-phosphate phosphatase